MQCAMLHLFERSRVIIDDYYRMRGKNVPKTLSPQAITFNSLQAFRRRLDKFVERTGELDALQSMLEEVIEEYYDAIRNSSSDDEYEDYD